MENKIEVGEYVRTNEGYIGQVKIVCKENQDDLNYYICDNDLASNFKKYIVNHSKNIIDLIEEGDYVNGYEVITVYGYDENGNDKDGLGICEVDDDYAYYIYLEDIDIKSIVTKEQFDSVKYITEEEKKCEK